MKRILTTGLLLASLSQGRTAEVASTKQVAGAVLPSVVLLMMEDAKGIPTSLGSGFLVATGVVATNLHVIQSTDQGYAKIVGRADRHAIKGTVGIDPAHDIVLLSIPALTSQPLRLASLDDLGIGDEVLAVGNPLGLEGTVSKGIISGIRTVGSDRLFQITAPISPGSSGGPVVNLKGEVIGIAMATLKGGQNLNFAIPATYIATLIKRREPLTALGRVATVQPRTSLFGGLGGRSAEGVIGTNFSWDDEDTSYSKWLHFSFSVKNTLGQAVKKINGLVIFRDERGDPIDTQKLWCCDEDLQAGLAVRKEGAVHPSVKRLCRNTEIRILDFALVE